MVAAWLCHGFRGKNLLESPIPVKPGGAKMNSLAVQRVI